VHQINKDEDSYPETFLISLDCKAIVKIGPFSRGGKSRLEQCAAYHDFEPEATLTPFGIFISESAESHLWSTKGPVTAMTPKLQMVLRVKP